MKLESHPLVSHAPQEKKKKRQESEGRRQRHGWIVAGLRMSIFEAHTRCFSVSPCPRPPPPPVLPLPLQDHIELDTGKDVKSEDHFHSLHCGRRPESDFFRSYKSHASIHLPYVWVIPVLHSAISQTTALSGSLTPLTWPYSASPKPRGVFTGFPP